MNPYLKAALTGLGGAAVAMVIAMMVEGGENAAFTVIYFLAWGVGGALVSLPLYLRKKSGD